MANRKAMDISMNLSSSGGNDMDVRQYIKNISKQQGDIAEKLAKIQSDIAGIADDVESNAQAIEELAEIIAEV